MPEENYVRYWIGPNNSIKDISYKYSPINHISNKSPSIISIHGENDRVFPYSQATSLHKKLDQNKVTNTLLTIDCDSHGYLEDKIQNKIDSLVFNFLLKEIKSD
tara:strand:+ start:369 stop:680 length:312 start_codon:yes stop_codon:yes gene_type:complete